MDNLPMLYDVPLSQLQERVRQSNEEFAAMTDAQKRVAIAQDVLKWLKLGKIGAMHMTYFELPRPVVGDLDQKDCKATLERKAGTCNVCAIGAAFYAAVRRADAVKIGELSSHSGSAETLNQHAMRAYLKVFFRPDQIIIMERAFEGWQGYHNFFAKYRTADARLKAVMKNIIKNEGELKIATDYKGDDE